MQLVDSAMGNITISQIRNSMMRVRGMAGFAPVLFVRMIFGETRYVEAFEQRLTERSS